MSYKIAVLEDDQAIREMYTLKLKSSGYHVMAAANGTEGLELLNSYTPDLILLDLMMPEMNGDEVLKKYRATPNGEKTLVIVLTNISRDEASKELEKLSITDYIVKANQTPSQVIEIVQKALKKR